MIRRPPRSTLFPSRRSSDLKGVRFCLTSSRDVFCVTFLFIIRPRRAERHTARNTTPSAGSSYRTACTAASARLLHRPPLTGRGRSAQGQGDRKSTRLNSSHGYISYAVFCLKKKKK